MIRKKLLIASISIIAILTLTVGLSYAWFSGSSPPAVVSGAMGIVDVSVTGEAVTANKEATFSITNSSNIGTYLRIGWTPIYQKFENGSWVDTTKDTSGIIVSSANLTPNISGGSLSPGTITSNGYSKNVLTLVDSGKKYFVLPAGTNVSGKVTLSNVSVGADERLVIIFIPEALQATKKAVKEAAAYGWLESNVSAQDASIAGGGNQ